jgi:hypothetical protein
VRARSSTQFPTHPCKRSTILVHPCNRVGNGIHKEPTGTVGAPRRRRGTVTARESASSRSACASVDPNDDIIDYEAKRSTETSVGASNGGFNVRSTVQQVRQVQGFRQRVDRRFETSALQPLDGNKTTAGSAVPRFNVQRSAVPRFNRFNVLHAARLWTSREKIVGCWTRATYRTRYIYPLEHHCLRT